MKDIGKTISKMGQELKVMIKVLSMKDNTRKACEMEKERKCWVMDNIMMDNGMRTRCMDMGFKYGLMEIVTKVNSKTTKSMATVYLLATMV